MNEKKISFILCCNNEYYMNECYLYLSELVIPEGYEVDLIEIEGAKSMAAGYNEGMGKTDAKYKIYMHQDVFITNKNFLIDLLDVFRTNDRIGLVGLVGTPYMSKNGTMWNGIRYGAFYNLKERFEKGMVKRLFPLTTGYMEMEAVDGLLMATQYDIPWREDIFQKWDYYDVSQCFEFLKAGYKVVVPGQNPEWYIHDCGIPNFDSCRRESHTFLNNYKEYMSERKEQTWEEYLEQVKIRVTEGFHGTEEARMQLLQFLDEMADE